MQRDPLAGRSAVAVLLLTAIVLLWALSAIVGPTYAQPRTPPSSRENTLVPFSPSASAVLATGGSPTVALDLLNGSTYVSPSLLETSYVDGSANRSLPSLLTGNATSAFWGSRAPVLMMSPDTLPYSVGLFLYSATPGDSVSIQSVGVGSPSIASGDGLVEYLFLTPVSNVSWEFPYWAGGPSGIGGGEGTLVFPDSITPYIVVQWEPFGCSNSCFNLYMVTPDPGGNVSGANIQAMGPLGSPPGVAPNGGDYLAFETNYSIRTHTLSAQMTDENNTSVDYRLSTNLSQDGFSPTYNGSRSYYFGAGGSAGGYGQSSWGILYSAVSSSASPRFAYLVTFTSSGLPPGTSWAVTLGGIPQSSTARTITFTEPNGTYPFAIENLTGYTANPSSGSLSVGGAPVTEAVSFGGNGGGGSGGLPPLLGLPGLEGYIVVGATVTVALIVGLLAALHTYAATGGAAVAGGAAGRRALRRKRKLATNAPSGSPPSAPAAGPTSSATGPGAGSPPPPGNAPSTGAPAVPSSPALACPSCGNPYAGTEKFCLSCGRPR